ncbi:MAG: hypothetical protein U0L91_04915, partial [Gemmiger sp.]|uniref:hypothetical protein n=1 Tax=Gemmiger sp. TaxID=2049027 RepID=UPI002E76FD40
MPDLSEKRRKETKNTFCIIQAISTFHRTPAIPNQEEGKKVHLCSRLIVRAKVDFFCFNRPGGPGGYPPLGADPLRRNSGSFLGSSFAAKRGIAHEA